MRYLTLAIILFFAPLQLSAQKQLPIIDMHLHANSFDVGKGASICTNDQKLVFRGWDPKEPIVFEKLMGCAARLQSASTNEAVMRESLALLERYNIWAVTSGPLERVKAWRAASPKRIIPAVRFDSHSHTPAELRRLVAEGSVAVFAEISAQYDGLSLADQSYDQYFALAEELDIPVGVHLGEGPPGGAHVLGGSTPSPYRADLTSPLQLEKVLVRHPKLRVYVMHYGSPLVDEMIALLFSHPQVYVDIACNNWAFPREHFYAQLKRLIDAGFEERIMWGSDQMIWPKVIEIAIKTIEEAPFLSEKQKRDIFYNNAARFLRLSSKEIAKHNGR